MDFRVYRPVWVGLAIGAAASWLFYDSAFGMFVAVPLIPVLWKKNKEKIRLEEKAQMKEEFRDTMVMVSGNLNAGYSLENAFLQVYKTNASEYIRMNRELERIANGLSYSNRIETLLLELGKRWDIAEIINFAKLIEAAKQYGGNIPQLIRQMTTNFSDIQETEMEIDTVIAAKRIEGTIMIAVPFGIMLMLRLINPSYIEVIYQTIAGRIWMTVCLVVIFLCKLWIEKIVRIEV